MCIRDRPVPWKGEGGHGMRKTGYVKSAAILTGTGLVLRAAGMVLLSLIHI